MLKTIELANKQLDALNKNLMYFIFGSYITIKTNNVKGQLTISRPSLPIHDKNYSGRNQITSLTIKTNFYSCITIIFITTNSLLENN